MLFYITEKIGATQYFSGRKLDCSHTKVGIAKNVGDRFKVSLFTPGIRALPICLPKLHMQAGLRSSARVPLSRELCHFIAA